MNCLIMANLFTFQLDIYTNKWIEKDEPVNISRFGLNNKIAISK